MIQRQLHRMRQQLATHGPGRSQDVTDLLPEDLLAADQQVDIMKRVAHLVGKRLANCMQGPANSDMEKRLKKLTLMSLSSAMADCMKETEGGSRLRRALEMGCCVEGSLAQALAEYEMNMERDVLQPLSKLSEEELPTILKHRKQLQKLLTDWNAAKSRLLQAQKNLSGPPGGGSPVTPPKLESLKEEEEDLRRRLDQSKDDYLSDLYQFTSKEPEYENYFIQLLELQAEYHRKSLTQLTEALGELRDTLKGSGQVPEKQLSADVYGVPLTTHLIRFGCEIALPISACVKMLLKHGIHEELLELQAEYHRKSLTQLTEALGELRDTLKGSGQVPEKQLSADVYGVPLTTHLIRFGCEIALPISACVKMLLKHGIHEEGLFRLAAGASVLKRLKTRLDAGSSDLREFISEPHAVAGALKSYLRELPEPLMTSHLFNDWMTAASIKEAEKRHDCYREVLQKLPAENYDNLRYLIKFLATLADYQEVNKMTPSNIAIVLGPNLLWAHSEGDPSIADMASASPILVVNVVEGLISCAAEVFPGDVDFGEMVEDGETLEVGTPSTDDPAAMPPPAGVWDRDAEAPRFAPEPFIKSVKGSPVLEGGGNSPNPAEFSPNTARRVKRPAPQRPSVPPPVLPRGPTDTSEDSPRPVPRRNAGGSLRVPNLPPPSAPQPPAKGPEPSRTPQPPAKGPEPPRTPQPPAKGPEPPRTPQPPAKGPEPPRNPQPLPRNRIQSTDD